MRYIKHNTDNGIDIYIVSDDGWKEKCIYNEFDGCIDDVWRDVPDVIEPDENLIRWLNDGHPNIEELTEEEAFLFMI